MSIINPLATPNFISPAINPVEPREGREQDLRPDQIVKATVVEGGLDKVMLEMRQQRFWAQTQVPLETGEQLKLLVTRTHPHIEFKLLEDQLFERLGRSLHLLGERPQILALLQRLQSEEGMLPPQLKGLLQGLQKFFGGMSEGAKAEELRSLPALLGLTLERALAEGGRGSQGESLKGLLLAALGRLPEGEEALTGQLSQSGKAIEAWQLCSLRLAQQGISYIPLPLPFLAEGYLLYKRPQRRDSEGETGPGALSLHLSLQGLGDLQVDLLQDGEGLRLRLLCESEEVARFIRSFQVELEEALAPFSLQGVSISGGAKNPVKQLIQILMADGHGVLDARV